MKRVRKLLAAMTMASLIAGCSSTEAQPSAANTGEEVYSIGLCQLVDHPSLNTIREAMMDEFEAQGYVEGENLIIDYQNAAGKTSNIDSIMSGYAADQDDLIIAIATPTALSAQNYADQIPVIFSACSNPVEVGLVESMEQPGGNITGTSNEIQVDQIVDLMLEVSPEVKTVGVLYNAGEANSVINVNNFKKAAEEKGLTVVERTGTDNTTLQQAAMDLAANCDAMFSPNDNTVATGMASLGQVARDAGIPYYVAVDSMVETGGFATVGISYEDLGRETAKMAIEVLNGKTPADIPVKVFRDDLSIYINEDLLNELEANGKTKVALPDSIASQENLIKVQTAK